MLVNRDQTQDAFDKELQTTFDAADRLRIEGLEHLLAFEASAIETHTKNAERLAKKLGKDDPRAITAVARIAAGKQFVAELRGVLERVHEETPVPDTGPWIVTGTVYDQNRKPVADVKVGFFDSNGKRVRRETAATDESGYFELKATDLSKFPDQVRVGVIGGDAGSELLAPAPGKRVFVEVFPTTKGEKESVVDTSRTIVRPKKPATDKKKAPTAKPDSKVKPVGKAKPAARKKPSK